MSNANTLIGNLVGTNCINMSMGLLKSMEKKSGKTELEDKPLKWCPI